jgi:hypothetical protein
MRPISAGITALYTRAVQVMLITPSGRPVSWSITAPDAQDTVVRPSAKCSNPRTTDVPPVRRAPPIEFVPTAPSLQTKPAAAPSRSIAEAVRAGAHRSTT